MEYKIVMPILSDTMDKGKLVKWYVKEGQYVKEGDKIAEVESDKATMDIQTFKSGVVKKLLVKEGEEVPVKSVIAIIDTEAKEVKSGEEKGKSAKEEVNREKKKERRDKEEGSEFQIANSEKKQNVQNSKPNVQNSSIHQSIHPSTLPKGSASPVAKKLASEYNIDIEKLQKENRLPTPVHEEDIKNYILKRYFTPAALKLLKEYEINPDEFELNHKIIKEEVLNYIKQNNIPKAVPLSANQKAVIKTVENAWSKPSYLMFDEIEVTKPQGIKLTAILIKALAIAMQKNPLTRSILKEDKLLTYPASNISVAVSRDDGLYMCVIKNAEDKSLQEINEWLKTIKTKRLTLDDLSGSTFGISNLGMFNVKRFTALINDKDCAIAAFGSLIDGKIKVTFTIDHRILNGVDTAKFVNDFKTALKEV